MKKQLCSLAVVVAMLLLLVAGCSDDETPPTADNNDLYHLGITLTPLKQIIEQVTPPEFNGISKAPPSKTTQGIDVYDWFTTGGEGGYPVLEKVFGPNNSMSLYSNLTSLDEAIEFINAALEAGDSAFAHPNDSDTTIGYTTIQELTTPTAIPEQCQPVLGTAPLDLDYYISINIADPPDMKYDCGFTKNDSMELVLTYFSAPNTDIPEYPNTVESNVFYAYHNLITDSIEIKAVFYKAYNNLDSNAAIWVYQINTVADSNFFYRMSWYAHNMGENEGVAGVVAGGNKDDEFALHYQQFIPPTLTDPDPLDPYSDLTQMFGPSYSDLGQTLTSSFQELTSATKMYHYSDMPTELLTNPLNPAQLMNPWGN